MIPCLVASNKQQIQMGRNLKLNKNIETKAIPKPVWNSILSTMYQDTFCWLKDKNGIINNNYNFQQNYSLFSMKLFMSEDHFGLLLFHIWK